MAIILASFATPENVTPPKLTVVPAAIPATWVPCSQSFGQGSPEFTAVELEAPPGQTEVVDLAELVVE